MSNLNSHDPHFAKKAAPLKKALGRISELQNLQNESSNWHCPKRDLRQAISGISTRLLYFMPRGSLWNSVSCSSRCFRNSQLEEQFSSQRLLRKGFLIGIIFNFRLILFLLKIRWERNNQFAESHLIFEEKTCIFEFSKNRTALQASDTQWTKS